MRGEIVIILLLIFTGVDLVYCQHEEVILSVVFVAIGLGLSITAFFCIGCCVGCCLLFCCGKKSKKD